MSTRSSTSRVAALLYGAAILTVSAAIFFIGWMIAQAQAYPGIQASQFGFEAPLWIPFGLFVGLCAAAMAFIFTRAARRVKSGEDLFSLRHRRRPSGSEPRSDETTG